MGFIKDLVNYNFSGGYDIFNIIIQSKQKMTTTNKKVWSVDMDKNLQDAVIERDRLRLKIKEAINLLEFHKNLLGEDFVRNKIINILKK